MCEKLSENKDEKFERLTENKEEMCEKLSENKDEKFDRLA